MRHFFQKPDLTVCGTCASMDRVMRKVVDKNLVPDVLAQYDTHMAVAESVLFASLDSLTHGNLSIDHCQLTIDCFCLSRIWVATGTGCSWRRFIKGWGLCWRSKGGEPFRCTLGQICKEPGMICTVDYFYSLQ